MKNSSRKSSGSPKASCHSTRSRGTWSGEGAKNYDDKIIIQIDFDGNIVSIEKKDLKNITLAYAITIHKSQGSEFEHVIMPICNNYSIMLYNKLIYTAVSRAKKSLTIIGEPSAFIRAVNNNYSMMRKTSLIEYLNKYYNV